MYFKVSWDQDFDTLMMHLWAKYGRDVFTQNGIGDQLDLNKFSKDFFNNNTTTADVSIDANANVSGKTIIDYGFEFSKPLQKYNSHYLFWKQLRSAYGLMEANSIIEKQINGEIYINDFSNGAIPYCFNYSTYDIALNGLTMSRRMTIKPPKSLESFIRQMEQFTVYAGNSTAGATGLADFLIVAAYYVDKIIRTGFDGHICVSGNIQPNVNTVLIYVAEKLKSFIYTLNWEFRGNQSPFTNVSVYDDHFLEKLVSDYVFLDGKYPDINTVKILQKIFIEAMNEELRRSDLTFPVTTACFYVKEGEIQDKEFLEYIAEQNLEHGFINIYYGDSSTLSSCCFSKDTKVLAKSSSGVIFDTFENINNLNYDTYRKNFTVYHNGSWCGANIVKVPVDAKQMFRVVTSNNKEMIVTEDHLHLTDCGDKRTDELNTSDYLAFNNRCLDSFPEKCHKLTYHQGFLLGLYLGDGSKYKRADAESYEITFSLNESNIPDLDIIKAALSDWGIEKDLHIHMQNNTMLTKVYSVDLFNIIGEYIKGGYAYEKELNMDVLLQSLDFRKGICDGWYSSDGGNSNRIYTVSDVLAEQAEVLFNSVGFNTVVDVSDRTGEGAVVIRGKSYNRNYPLYCIRWYDMKNKRSMAGRYKVLNNTEYFKIKLIEKVSYEDEYVYCFEMKNQAEPYFTLPNGIITHNCRLRSSTDNEYFNSFGAGSTKIGSLGVVTVNLPRLAYLSEAREDFIEKVRESAVIVAKINNAKRNIIKKRIELNSMPLYSLGHMDLSKQYSTYGVTGLNEALKSLGYDILSEEGEQFVLDILDAINDENDKMANRFKSPHNCEQVPAESSAVTLAKRDRTLKYQDKYFLYSNQFIPLTTQADVLDRLRVQGKFDGKFSGGAICHVNVGEKIKDKQILIDLMIYAAKCGVVYWAVNYALKRCVNSHVFVDEDICPFCGGGIDHISTRTVGFFTNVDNWNQVRREHDFPNRQFYRSSNGKYL